ncbi:P-loop containing nucleoside triphosphate hydrolase protein [Phycomyces nitens]|nr:P-loop containing nucleoside triphosphate hydrolase protein [Phycomyces nitens]
MPLKIIGAGYGRTGTNSLRLALETLGYRTHHMVCLMSDSTQDPFIWKRAFDNPDSYLDEWESVYGKYNAAIDWPTATTYKQLMKKYPDAKIILTVRSAESWYKSMCSTIFKLLENDNDSQNTEHMNRILALQRSSILGGYLKEDLSKVRNKEELCRLYDEHTKEVKQFVPPENLLVLELGEGWDRLCKFLEVPVPGIPYPNTNSSGEEFRDFLDSASDTLKKPKNIVSQRVC